VEVEDAREAVLEALKSYMRSNGRRLLAMIDALGQEEVVIYASALYSYFKPRPSLERLDAALGALHQLGVREVARGIRLVEGEPLRLRVSKEVIRELLAEEEP